MAKAGERCGTLVFVRWYCKTAIYRDGQLAYWGEGACDFGLLQALGFSCETGPEVPTHNIPPEFTGRNEIGHWLPPEELKTLLSQFVAWERRKQRQRLAALRQELARLEAEEASGG